MEDSDTEFGGDAALSHLRVTICLNSLSDDAGKVVALRVATIRDAMHEACRAWGVAYTSRVKLYNADGHLVDDVSLIGDGDVLILAPTGSMTPGSGERPGHSNGGARARASSRTSMVSPAKASQRRGHGSFATEREGATPRMVGPYKVLRLLGEGGFGAVRLGQHAVTGELAALKFLAKGETLSAGDADRIITEISCLTELVHPNIIHLQHVFNDAEHMVIALDFAPGGDLKSYVDRQFEGRLSEADASDKFTQVVKGIAFAHARKIVHKDLKLENILLGPSPTGTSSSGSGSRSRKSKVKNGAPSEAEALRNSRQCLITDFGLSQYTRPGEVKIATGGSLYYMCPEILLSLPTTGQAIDVWCLGVMLFALLVGRTPFRSSLLDNAADKLKEEHVSDHAAAVAAAHAAHAQAQTQWQCSQARRADADSSLMATPEVECLPIAALAVSPEKKGNGMSVDAGGESLRVPPPPPKPLSKGANPAVSVPARSASVASGPVPTRVASTLSAEGSASSSEQGALRQHADLPLRRAPSSAALLSGQLLPSSAFTGTGVMPSLTGGDSKLRHQHSQSTPQLPRIGTGGMIRAPSAFNVHTDLEVESIVQPLPQAANTVASLAFGSAVARHIMTPLTGRSISSVGSQSVGRPASPTTLLIMMDATAPGNDGADHLLQEGSQVEFPAEVDIPFEPRDYEREAESLVDLTAVVKEIRAAILGGIAKVRMPEYLSEDAADLIVRLLQPEADRRLPVNEILCHPWFLSSHTAALRDSAQHTALVAVRALTSGHSLHDQLPERRSGRDPVVPHDVTYGGDGGGGTGSPLAFGAALSTSVCVGIASGSSESTSSSSARGRGLGLLSLAHQRHDDEDGGGGDSHFIGVELSDAPIPRLARPRSATMLAAFGDRRNVAPRTPIAGGIAGDAHANSGMRMIQRSRSLVEPEEGGGTPTSAVLATPSASDATNTSSGVAGSGSGGITFGGRSTGRPNLQPYGRAALLSPTAASDGTGTGGVSVGSGEEGGSAHRQRPNSRAAPTRARSNTEATATGSGGGTNSPMAHSGDRVKLSIPLQSPTSMPSLPVISLSPALASSSPSTGAATGTAVGALLIAGARGGVKSGAFSPQALNDASVVHTSPLALTPHASTISTTANGANRSSAAGSGSARTHWSSPLSPLPQTHSTTVGGVSVVSSASSIGSSSPMHSEGGSLSMRGVGNIRVERGVSVGSDMGPESTSDRADSVSPQRESTGSVPPVTTAQGTTGVGGTHSPNVNVIVSPTMRMLSPMNALGSPVVMRGPSGATDTSVSPSFHTTIARNSSRMSLLSLQPTTGSPSSVPTGSTQLVSSQLTPQLIDYRPRSSTTVHASPVVTMRRINSMLSANTPQTPTAGTGAVAVTSTSDAVLDVDSAGNLPMATGTPASSPVLSAAATQPSHAITSIASPVHTTPQQAENPSQMVTAVSLATAPPARTGMANTGTGHSPTTGSSTTSRTALIRADAPAALASTVSVPLSLRKPSTSDLRPLLLGAREAPGTQVDGLVFTTSSISSHVETTSSSPRLNSARDLVTLAPVNSGSTGLALSPTTAASTSASGFNQHPQSHVGPAHDESRSGVPGSGSDGFRHGILQRTSSKLVLGRTSLSSPLTTELVGAVTGSGLASQSTTTSPHMGSRMSLVTGASSELSQSAHSGTSSPTKSKPPLFTVLAPSSSSGSVLMRAPSLSAIPIQSFDSFAQGNPSHLSLEGRSLDIATGTDFLFSGSSTGRKAVNSPSKDSPHA